MNSILLVIQIVVLSILIVFQSFGQDNHYESGMIALEKRDYNRALEYFDAALENKFLMKGKYVPRAYNYRAKAVAEYFKIILENSQLDFITENPNILVNAFEDLDQAIIFDDGKCSGLINETKGQLFEVTFMFGQAIADSLRIDRGSNDPKTDSLILLVIDELLILKDLQGESYEINDLLGLLEYKGGNTDKAIEFFNKSEEIYRKDPPLAPDYNHAYNYYYDAIINYSINHEFDAALTSVKTARKFINNYFQSNQEAILFDKKLEALEFQIKLLQH